MREAFVMCVRATAPSVLPPRCEGGEACDPSKSHKRSPWGDYVRASRATGAPGYTGARS